MKDFIINKNLTKESREEIEEASRRGTASFNSKMNVGGGGYDEANSVSVKAEGKSLSTSLTALAGALKNAQKAHDVLMKKAITDQNMSTAGYIEQEIADLLDSAISDIDYSQPFKSLESLAKQMAAFAKKLS